VLLCTAAACSDAPTASRAALPAARHDGAAAVTTLRPPTLIPNRIKYRDAGYHPATGRAGSASLYLQALVGRDGKTEMQVATSPWGITDGWAPGAITHLQVKALDSAGKLLATRTHGADLPGGGAATLTYGGMARGTQLRVQGTVRGIDAHRTDVPVVTGTVRLRPNLAVYGVTAPARVREGPWGVPISATVTETNGDVGAMTMCRLYVDGVPRDWAGRIWVDAGDAVTCLFSAVFSSAGKHRVEVRLEDMLPRDDDPADNTASAEVEVEADDELLYSASVYSVAHDNHVFTRSRWTVDNDLDNFGSESGNETRSSNAHQEISFSGWSMKGMSRLPRVEVEEESAGAPVFSIAYDFEITWENYDWTCGQGLDGAIGVFVAVCTSSDAFGGTNLTYGRWSTRVTYHSTDWGRYWDAHTGEDQVYHYNYDDGYEEGLAPAALGSDFTIRVRLVADGTQFSAVATFPLQTEELRFDSPLTCWTESYAWAGATSEYCSLYEDSRKTVFGSKGGRWPF
jgi:hypothetical protein